MEKELKTLLRKLAAEYETKDFINDDHVRFVHAYADKQDMEIVGFIASWLAYGNRKVIVSTIQALINEMNYLSSGSPFVFYSGTQVGTDRAPKRCRSVPLLQMG